MSEKWNPENAVCFHLFLLQLLIWQHVLLFKLLVWTRGTGGEIWLKSWLCLLFLPKESQASCSCPWCCWPWFVDSNSTEILHFIRPLVMVMRESLASSSLPCVMSAQSTKTVIHLFTSLLVCIPHLFLSCFKIKSPFTFLHVLCISCFTSSPSFSFKPFPAPPLLYVHHLKNLFIWIDFLSL